MPENPKKNGVLSVFKGVFKGKKEQCADIQTQADKVISDYINKRRSEIMNKYCKKKYSFFSVAVFVASGFLIYLVYALLV